MTWFLAAGTSWSSTPTTPWKLITLDSKHGFARCADSRRSARRARSSPATRSRRIYDAATTNSRPTPHSMIACRQRSPTSRTASESSRRRTQRNLARGSNDQRNSATRSASPAASTSYRQPDRSPAGVLSRHFARPGRICLTQCRSAPRFVPLRALTRSRSHMRGATLRPAPRSAYG